MRFAAHFCVPKPVINEKHCETLLTILSNTYRIQWERSSMNLETIARLSGVSRSTVSRVINHSPSVSPDVRERVLQVLRETNFQPNVAARSLAAGSTHILGLVVPMRVSQMFNDPYFPLLVKGVSAACNARDYTVMLWLDEPQYERRIIRQILHSGLIDGVVVTSLKTNDPLIDAFLDRQFPFVVVGRIAGERPVHFVDVDNIGSACHAVEHLIRLGRRRVMTITGPLTHFPSADRLEGYRRAMEKHSLIVDPSWIAESDFTQEGGLTAMRRLLPLRPDAVFVASDAMAQGAAMAIQEAGLIIPEDIALVGFDDLPFSAHMSPPLTTVRQPIERLGWVAVEILLNILKGAEDIPNQMILPTELIVRQTCGGILNAERE
jgi:LacI family transcriptional regulator